MEKAASPQKRIFEGLMVIFGYMISRWVVYHLFPVWKREDWSYRDAFMDIPRLMAFAFLLILNQKRWGRVTFDFKLRMNLIFALFYGIAFVGIYGFKWSMYAGSRWSFESIALGIPSTVFVATFEEYAFRGVLLKPLVEMFGVGFAIIMDAVLFALYHIQAQEWILFPELFFVGIIFAAFRVMGFSLFWLAVIHFIIDSMMFFVPTNEPMFWSGQQIMMLSLLAILAGILFLLAIDNKRLATGRT